MCLDYQGKDLQFCSVIYVFHYKKIEEVIIKQIAKSEVPEDFVHSKDTVKWLLKIKPDADVALKIAALGHDIDRSTGNKKVKREDYKSYDGFKKAHALNSARIIADIMKSSHANQELIDEVYNLITNHETGGDKRSDILKYSDSISFFNVNLPYYFERNTEEETRRRCIWGLERLPKSLQNQVFYFEYDSKKLNSLMHSLRKKFKVDIS